MSTRYVWAKNKLQKSFVASDVPNNQYASSYAISGGYGSLIGYAGTGVTLIKDGNGTITGVDLQNASAVREIEHGKQPVSSLGQYFAFTKKQGISEYIKAQSSAGYWSARSGNKAFALVEPHSIGADVSLPITKYSLVSSKGDLLEDLSSANSKAFPTTSGGAESGGYWYTYKGSDNIDPSSISYPATGLDPGRSITVSIAPGTSNVHGGTITYRYQCRLDGGAWQDLTSTVNTSVLYTIPDNVSNLQFRVQASDDMGFTSSDFVTGASAAVTQFKAYVGIGGTARKIDKLYVGVDGKARQIIKGYIGVNGKAQRFM